MKQTILIRDLNSKHQDEKSANTNGRRLAYYTEDISGVIAPKLLPTTPNKGRGTS